MKKLIAVVLTLVCADNCVADDWPQWMGPQRDNVWRETGLLDKFPEDGPKVLWRAPVAIGYAGPAVSDGRVFVMDFDSKDNVKVSNFNRKKFSGTETVRCLDAKTGKPIWKHEYEAEYNVSYPSGPRCTPTVHEGKVYTLGGVGHLYCLDAKTGKILWSKNLPKEHKTDSALWGYAAHPLIYEKTLITLVGGEGSHAVAFDKDTGKEIWRTLTSKGRGYSPPKLAKVGGVEQLILAYPEGVSGVDPKTGKVQWTTPYEATNTSIIMTPIVWKDYVFVGGYQNKNLLVKLGSATGEVEVLWKDKRDLGFSPLNVQPFEENGFLYGIDGQGVLYGVQLPSGERKWSTSEPVSKRPVGSGTAFFVKQDKRFWMFNDSGELLIAKMSPTGYEEIDRAKIVEPTNTAFGRQVVWSVPAYANKCAFVRNDKEIVCVSLAK